MVVSSQNELGIDLFRRDRERGLCVSLLIRTTEVWSYKLLLELLELLLEMLCSLSSLCSLFFT